MKRSVALFTLLLAACSFLDKHDPISGWSAAKLYQEAKVSLDNGQYDLAIQHYETLEARFPNVDYVYYLKGLVYFNEDLGLFGKLSRQDRTERDPKSARESFDAFKDLVQRFPESRYTPDALARMKYLVNALASHEVHVARYYMKRGAYVAAANRAQYALKNYPQAPVQEEALLIMVQAYNTLGMPELRDDAERVLRRNFPESAHLKSLLSQLGR
jgi:outer membrane protein assembly factor BamD